MWPSSEAVAKRAGNLYADFKQGLEIQKYATTGQEDRRLAGPKGKRGNSPSKTGGSMIGPKGGNLRGSSSLDDATHQTISSEVSHGTKPKA